LAAVSVLVVLVVVVLADVVALGAEGGGVWGGNVTSLAGPQVPPDSLATQAWALPEASS
jgi:hypothetical protein